MSEPINCVRLIVDLRFEGDYWRPEELVDMATSWINSGLDDRDDLREWKVSGELLPTSVKQEDRPKIGRPLAVGDVIHGFAGSVFGYRCMRVEALGADWGVFRPAGGGVEFLSGREDVYAAQVARDEGNAERCAENWDLCIEREGK